VSGHADRSAGGGESPDGCRTVSGVRTLERDRTSGVDSRAAAPAGLLGIHLNYPASVPPEIDRAICTPGGGRARKGGRERPFRQRGLYAAYALIGS
jgi:hypothetical protein